MIRQYFFKDTYKIGSETIESHGVLLAKDRMVLAINSISNSCFPLGIGSFRSLGSGVSDDLNIMIGERGDIRAFFGRLSDSNYSNIELIRVVEL